MKAMVRHSCGPPDVLTLGEIREMTLQEFLKVTAEVDARDLRRALALALQREVPRSRASYARFYRRVIDTLVESDARVVCSPERARPRNAEEAGYRSPVVVRAHPRATGRPVAP